QDLVNEALDENLDPDSDHKDWKWQALSQRVNTLWGVKTTDRQLKQIGRDNLGEYLLPIAEKSVAEIDLSKGSVYLEPDWGRRSLCDWLEHKFEIKIDPRKLEEMKP